MKELMKPVKLTFTLMFPGKDNTKGLIVRNTMTFFDHVRAGVSP